MLALLLVLLSCAPPTGEGSGLRAPTAQATRISMALRGVRPTVEELEAVQRDPGALEALVDGWIADPRFGETVRDLHAEVLWLRTDVETPLPPIGPLAGATRGDVQASVAEGPLRLVERVVTAGRPYDEILTTPETLVDRVLAELYGLPFDPDGPEWQVSTWQDGRPAAGLLSDNGVWLRHISSDTNHHRARAATVLRAFLCEDLSDRDLGVLGLDLTDGDAVADAVRTEPGCVGCHGVLDPLAATFWGYKRYILRREVAAAYAAGCPDPDFCYPFRYYDPSDEGRWGAVGQPPPGWFGERVDDLEHLGLVIAADPRFARCAARRFAAWFEQRPLEDVEEARVDALVEVFEASSRDARELARAVVTDPGFLAATSPPRRVRPEQFARMLHDLTGFRWVVSPDAPGCEDRMPTCWGPVDMLANDRYGFRVLAGGIDGYDVREPVHTFTPTSVLVYEQAAFEAAGFVVDEDLSKPRAQRRLLRQVQADTTDPAQVRAQLAGLRSRILGRLTEPDSPEIEPLASLWEGAFSRHRRTEPAWKLVIAALLVDPEAWTW